MSRRGNIVASSILAAASGFVGSVVLFYAWNLIAGTGLGLWMIRRFGDAPWFYVYTWMQGLLINVVLSLPVAAILCLLRPRRLIVYTTLAVVPVFIWSNVFWFGDDVFFSLWPSLLPLWLSQLLFVPLAVVLLRKMLPASPPNNALQQSGFK